MTTITTRTAPPPAPAPAAATPAGRERYVDFLRVFSLAVVMLGHWLMAAVSGATAGWWPATCWRRRRRRSG